MTHCKISI